MYFTKVELHNFGIYKGTHEMCLTDQIGNRNITLVGGLNGRGKTTFHDSILIALYGKQALKYIQEKARSYDKLLLDHINKHATDEETYVAVSLCLDDGTVLRVKRSWTARGKKVEQQTIVEKDGVVDKYLGESWSYYIEEILPFGIARFFFFNNEKITQLADDTSFEQIKSSIKSAIGVSTIEKAIEHTDEVDPSTLDVTILDLDGNELLKSQLSAGEQQMFAVAIVWALALTSGYKAPVIIDTPMARLDSSHRANFVTKYLPAASSQVMVLSTDEEVYGRYLDLVRDNVVDYYTLLYREEEQCTSIVHGYFGEV